MSDNYQQEVDEKTKTLVKYIIEKRELVQAVGQVVLPYVDPNDLLIKYKENVVSLVKDDPRPPFIVVNSSFKTPQSVILVAYYPEKEFVFRLIDSNRYLESWIKSPDKGFYSIDYRYWKGGKDQTVRSFNPDFFIKINIDKYIEILKKEGQGGNLNKLKQLQELGIESIIKVVEIKSNEDDDEATPAKAEFAKKHFFDLNKKLIDDYQNIDKEFKSEAKQFYTFDLLKPKDFASWFFKLETGEVS